MAQQRALRAAAAAGCGSHGSVRGTLGGGGHHAMAGIERRGRGSAVAPETVRSRARSPPTAHEKEKAQGGGLGGGAANLPIKPAELVR